MHGVIFPLGEEFAATSTVYGTHLWQLSFYVYLPVTILRPQIVYVLGESADHDSIMNRPPPAPRFPLSTPVDR